MNLKSLVNAAAIKNLKSAVKESEQKKERVLAEVAGEWGMEFTVNKLVEKYIEGVSDPTKFSATVNIADIFKDMKNEDVANMKVSEALTDDDFKAIALEWCEDDGPFHGNVDMVKVGRGNFFKLTDAFIASLTA